MTRLSFTFIGVAALALGTTAYGHVTSNYSCTNCHTSETGHANLTSTLLTTAVTDPGVVAGTVKVQVVAGGTAALSLRVTDGFNDYAALVGGWTSATTDSGVLNASNTLTFAVDSTWNPRTSGGFFATKGPLAFGSATTHTYNMSVNASTPQDYYLMNMKSSGLGDAGLWTQSFPVYLQVFKDFTYNVNANGNISGPTNFMPNGVPTGTVGRVVFGNIITAPRTVTIDQNVSLISLAFDNSAAAYTLAGTSSISIAGSAATPAIDVRSGNHTISAPLILTSDTRIDVAAGSSLTVAGTLNAAARNLYKQGPGALNIPATSLNSVSLSGGTINVSGTANTVVRAATIDAGAVLNIGSSPLVVDYVAGSSPAAALLASVADGRLGSSNVTTSNRAIGSADTAQFTSLTSYNGTNLDATTLVFVATLKGDTDLDKSVTFGDLLALAQNYGSAGKVWTQGDTNYDGSVNFTDLLALAQNYGLTALADGSIVRNDDLAAGFRSDWALARSIVPEPVLLASFAFGAMLTLRRR